MIERYTLPEMGAVWSEQAKFQSWLDVEIAATEANCHLGRVPQEALDTIKAKAHFSVERILEIEAEVRRIEKVETAVEPGFQQHFVNAMAFPHATLRFEQLARVVDLPAPAPRAEQGSGRRRRRRR